MKQLLALPLLVIGAITFMTGCMVQGPPGPPGKDGTDGLNGDSALASCMKCHSDSNFNIKTEQYQYSKHFLGTTVARGQSNRFCARCHTNEGFQEITWNGMPFVAAEMPNATKIQCATCHTMTGFDFSNDTTTINEILRTNTPVPLLYLNQVTLSGWTTTNTFDFSQGASKINNLCATCHQIRGATQFTYTDTVGGKSATKAFAQIAYFPMGTAILPGDTAIAAKGNLKQPADSVAYLVGRSFAVHNGNQSNILYGMNGYDFGTPIVTGPRHHAKSNCVDCHMNAWDSTTHTGGHSLIVNLDDPACNACHNLRDTLAQDSTVVSGLLKQLGDALAARKVAVKSTSSSGVVSYSFLNTHDFYGKLYSNNPADSAVVYASLTSANKTDSATGVIDYINNVTYSKDSNLKNRIGRKWTYGELGAAYNYGFISSENDLGKHNSDYTKKLLQASINWLAAHP